MDYSKYACLTRVFGLILVILSIFTMMGAFFSKKSHSIEERCKKDDLTQLRLKYDPYYKTFEKQKESHVWLKGKEMIMMSSNDYLGLTHHSKVIEAGKKALDLWGSSTTGARLANGSRSYHRQLEERLASFLGKEDAMVSSAGYLSCMAAVQTFLQKDDLAIVDKNVHSCLWAGLGLSQAKIERFAHNDPKDLAEILALENEKTPKMVLFEGVYSMEGHLAKLPEILEVTRGHDCFLVMDDAHGIGVMGHQGRGTANHFQATDAVQLITGSFSKALSSTGGFVAGSKPLMDYLRTHSKQTIFSAALSPCQAACAEAALDILESDPEPLQKLWDNVAYYKKILSQIGLNTWGSVTPAIPIVLGSKEKAFKFWDVLMQSGVFSVISIAPAVPPGKDLIRTAVSARHTREDLDKVGEVMALAAKKI